MLNCFSCAQFSVTLWAVACHVPLSMGLLRQEYWNGLSCPPLGDLPNSGTELMSLMSPALAGGFLPLAPCGKPYIDFHLCVCVCVVYIYIYICKQPHSQVALVVEESACQCRRCKIDNFDPWVGKVPWSRKWQPVPVFLPGKSHGHRGQVGLQSVGSQRQTGLSD